MGRGALLSTGEAAKKLDVHPETLRRWERDGVLISERTAGGHRRYPISELEALYAQTHAPQTPGSFPIKVEFPEELYDQISSSYDNVILITECMCAKDYAPDEITRAITRPDCYLEHLEHYIEEAQNPPLAWQRIISSQSEWPLSLEKFKLLLSWMEGGEYESEDVVQALKDPAPYLEKLKAEIGSW